MVVRTSARWRIEGGCSAEIRARVFFVQLGGWDLHGGQVNGHCPLLTEISAALGAFHEATVEFGAANHVTVRKHRSGESDGCCRNAHAPPMRWRTVRASTCRIGCGDRE